MVTKLKNKKTIIYIASGISLVILAILIPLGFASGYDSNNVFFDNSSSSINTNNLKESIDKMNHLADLSCPSNMTCKSNTPKCIRATTLHTETCNNSSSNEACQAAGYASGATITYGNTTTTPGILAPGDAFDCNVDGTGYNHRFYYISDYFETTENYFNENIAVLVYYSDTIGGIDSTQGTQYECHNKNYIGPITAMQELPTTTQWNNIRLYKEIRQILTIESETTAYFGELPSNFSYSGYAARLLTYQEVYHGCFTFTKSPTNERGSSTGGLEGKCLFLLERSLFSSSSISTYGSWLETPSTASYSVTMTFPEERVIWFGGANLPDVGVRPVIELPKTEIQY